ncbi:MAG: hypothetical protein WDM94_05725 [Bauldia sp.]
MLAALGPIGLTVTFNNTVRDKTLDHVIRGVDAAVVLYAIWLLFF